MPSDNDRWTSVPDQTPLAAEEVAELLGLERLPVEGGRWAQTWLDEESSGIYYLMTPGDFSHLHRLDGVELWHFYGGAPVQMVFVDADGRASRSLLHNRLIDGSRPVIAVAPGVAMGAYTTGDWSLIGTTMAPPYHDDRFQLVTRDELFGELGLLGAVSDEMRQHLERVTHP